MVFKMTSCIYVITNIVNDKQYVGQTNNKNKRFKDHIKTLKGDYHCNRYLQRAYYKYGIKNFIFTILEVCLVEQLNKCEQYWIDKLNTVQPNVYNLAPVAGSMLGYKHTDEARDNMRKAQLGKKQTKDHIEKRASAMIGNKNAAGVKQSFERIEARAVLHRGKPKSAEHKAKIAEGNRGRTISDDTREKMRQSALNRKKSIDKFEKSGFSTTSPSWWG